MTGAATPSAEGGAGALRPGSRAANRAAKRAVSGVRPKTAARGAGRRSHSSRNAILLLAIGAVVIVAAVIAIGNPFAAPAAPASPTAPLVVGDGTCPTAQPAALGAGETRTVTIATPKGNIVLEIDADLSPIAAGNFVALVTCHFYDGSVFHRTASLGDGTPFVIQGGAAKPGTGDIPYTIKDEPVTASYGRGTLAMARTKDPNSQTSQFFIVLTDAAGAVLKSTNTYAIFGKVVSGMDVADAIFDASAGAELPTDPIPMTSVTIGPAPTAAPTTAPTVAPTATTPVLTPAASTAPTTAP